MAEQWTALQSMPVPPLDEVLAQAQKQPRAFPEPSEISGDWILASQTYRTAFSSLLLERTGLDRLDRRIAGRGILPVPESGKNFWQKYDTTGLQYFYIRTMPRTERLADPQRFLLAEAARTPGPEAWENVLALVSESFRTVMAFAPDEPDTVFEPVMTLSGSFQIFGREIPLGLRSCAAFNPDGSLADEEQEKRRVTLFNNIWRQTDPLLSRDLGCPVRTAVEIF